MTYATEPHTYSPIQKDSSKPEASPLGNTKLNKTFHGFDSLKLNRYNRESPSLSHLNNQQTYQGSKRHNNTATITTLFVKLVTSTRQYRHQTVVYVFYLGGWNIHIYKGVTHISLTNNSHESPP